jgi:hypothetical protein
MTQTVFTDAQIAEIEAHGLSVQDALEQIRHLQNPPKTIVLDRPCTTGDGIRVLSEVDLERFLGIAERARLKGRFMKFVPASGAGTRMFRSLLIFYGRKEPLQLRDVMSLSEQGNAEARDLVQFVHHIHDFAFYEDLKEVLMRRSLGAESGGLKGLLASLLCPEGLDYAEIPKGLMKFHRYRDHVRTAVEEHLVEAADYARDRNHISRIHFTVSPEYLEHFEVLIRNRMDTYERIYGCRFDVGFSMQKRTTDTLSVNAEEKPFLLKNGSLLFRPGGHGALIENLGGLKADIVFIKNIDNVAPDRLKHETFLWKKALAGLLVELQDKIFESVSELELRPGDEAVLKKAEHLVTRLLFVGLPDTYRASSPKERRQFLLKKLNRPLRVCGMVKNTGEPGGGPFWVRETSGETSLQIVESAQLKQGAQSQESIFRSSTHFNPVDIVCGLHDWRGESFDLTRFVDQDAVFISRKSQSGRELAALERPGFWNGGMSDWNTIFVEVPAATFTPIKTLQDLLRPEHRFEPDIPGV